MAIGAEFTGFNYMKESVVADIKKIFIAFRYTGRHNPRRSLLWP